MKSRKITYLIVSIMALALMSATTMTPYVNAAISAENTFTLPVTGTIGGVPFTNGVFTIGSFQANGDQLLANGKLTVPGVMKNQKTTIPVQMSSSTSTSLQSLQALTASCDILSLSLGPVDLDLLGLVVHLDEVNLDINAEAGPGNLVGNLLCAVAGLLDNGLSLGLVADLLSFLVDLFNELGL